MSYKGIPKIIHHCVTKNYLKFTAELKKITDKDST